MSKRYLTAGKAYVGAKIPWNIFNEEGRLLLKANEPITSELQAYRLATQGLYFDVKAGSSDQGIAEREPASVLRILNLASKLLQKTLPNLEREGDGEAKVTAIAELVLEALELNADVAVACILMNQEDTPYSYRHMVDTAVLAGLLGQIMKLAHEELLIIVSAALTMNIAMLDYQDKLNLKRGGLTEEGRSLIHRHPQKAVEILQNAGVKNEKWLSYVLSHHESEDGSGYPAGKKGDEIPDHAKLIAMADRYTARLMNKYRPPLLPNVAIRDILAGKEFAPKLTAYLVKAIGLHPTGTAVRLKNGQIGIVTKKNATPAGLMVHVTIAANGMPQEHGTVRDTDIKEFAVREELPREEAGTHPMIDLWGVVAAH
ncbi:MAG: HD domain-containing protein [Methylophilales bacterium]|nr:HD domain-containing protein [Methylophilales bacterium]